MLMAARPTTRRCPTCGCLPLEWLDAKTVHKVLGVSEKSVIRKVQSGQLWGRQFGRLWRIRHHGTDPDGIPGLDEYLESEKKS